MHLRRIDPAIYEKVKPYLFVSDPNTAKFSSVSVTGENLYSITSSQTTDEMAMLRWWHIQEILISLLPDKSMLLLNHQLVDIVHESEDEACAEFLADRQRVNLYKNWEGNDDKVPTKHGPKLISSVLHTAGLTAQPFEYRTDNPAEAKKVKIRAKLIIAADGINSTARKCIYRESGEGWENYAGAVYSGLVRVGALGRPNISEEDEQTIIERYTKIHRTCMISCDKEKNTIESPRAVVVRPVQREQNEWSWKCVFYAAFDEARLAKLSAEEVMDSVHELAENSGFPKEIIRLSKALWEDNESTSKSIRALYVVPATHPPPYECLSTAKPIEYPADFWRPWYHKRVVLAGDALHASPPFHAQGNAMGMEDVHELVVRLAASGIWSADDKTDVTEKMLETIFEEYRNARIDRVCFQQRITINRVSEHDNEQVLSDRKVTWNYEPTVRDP